MVLKNWLRDVLQFFFPRYCWLCGRRLTIGEEHLCTDCILSIPRTDYHLKPGNAMEQNFWGLYPVDRASAYFFYHKDGLGSTLLYHIKYYNHPWVGEYLGRCMAQEIKATSDFFEGIDVMVPVPLHPQKQRKRGYNQCHYISLGISAITGIAIDEDMVIRTRANDTQTHKMRDDRLANVISLFRLKEGANPQDKIILIVDDVCTTGATIGAVLDAFSSVPNVHFRILTLGLASSLH